MVPPDSFVRPVKFFTPDFLFAASTSRGMYFIECSKLMEMFRRTERSLSNNVGKGNTECVPSSPDLSTVGSKTATVTQ